MSKMTAEQVATELDRRAESESGDDGCWNVAVAHGDAAKLVRENLVESENRRRERFEAWRMSQGEHGHYLSRDARSGKYQEGMTDWMWRTWQAAMTYRDEPQRGDA